MYYGFQCVTGHILSLFTTILPMNKITEKPFAYAMITVYFLFHILGWFAHGKDCINSDNEFLSFSAKSWIFFSINAAIAYFSAAFSDPGFLTEDWNKNHPNEKFTSTNQEDEKLFCDKCKITRPPRAHHCKECKKCVILFDHHCVFVDNCIGYRTLRPYLVFLITFPLDGIFGCLMMITNMNYHPGKHAFKALVFAFSLLYYFAFLLVDFYQLYILISNLIINSTEVENERDKSQKPDYDLMCVDQVPEFDTNSIIKNLKMRLGNNPFLWLFPYAYNDLPILYPKNKKFVPYSQVKVRKTHSMNQNDIEKANRRK
ncbi:zinc finger protein DHHC domain containing protein [Tritrichomonas foetus]|uniref:Palmitoyltransferase n=1 Tax=Tritrichomonas foetus TaxID=1144522 RepID=A0A1J4KVF6_9EUKA|nr:zinc finger protein DHHC domain containing protein [Tritrichomonas foetus]|eukprot:OHT15289.1 zinc finger protein DHHC domain containing protein [Tritrichomonas foetus]